MPVFPQEMDLAVMSEEVKDREDGKNMEMHAGNVESSKSLAIPNPRCFRDSAIPGKHPWASAHHWLVTGSGLPKLHYASRR